MIDETDIGREIKWFFEQRARIVVTNLNKRNINAQYARSRKEALSAVMEMIPEGATVTRGDSVTLEQIGIIGELRKRKQYKFKDAFARTDDGYYVLDMEQRFTMWREAFFADVFLTGTNAVTLDGKLVNIDAAGNRVAAMIFGPEKVIVVAGANKIVKDVTEAIERIHQVAAPLNAQRHCLKHHQVTEYGDLPCVKTSRCIDCNHEWKICLNTVIIEGTWHWVRRRINVVLVGEELGL